MCDTIRQFSWKHPSLLLLICGLLICASAYGANENIHHIAQYMPDRFRIVYQNYQFTIVVSEIFGFGIGIALIGLSALVAVRSFVKKKRRIPE